ncbi:hypothetical protein ACEWPM_008850 [Roseovarius sp. S4756]|uniref:hypothetical protein n=1 Tax=Roseovarius maritimus TaxID=3342637 RepID=UPI003726BDD9
MALRPILATIALFAAVPAMAEVSKGAAVSIELNAAKTVDGACTLSFLVQNGHDVQIDQAIYETVLFDVSGQVDRLTLFDLGSLPPGRPRVRQFSVAAVTCEGIGSILINGAQTCSGVGLPEGACERGLILSSRTDIEVMG